MGSENAAATEAERCRGIDAGVVGLRGTDDGRRRCRLESQIGPCCDTFYGTPGRLALWVVAQTARYPDPEPGPARGGGSLVPLAPLHRRLDVLDDYGAWRAGEANC